MLIILFLYVCYPFPILLRNNPFSYPFSVFSSEGQALYPLINLSNYLSINLANYRAIYRDLSLKDTHSTKLFLEDGTYYMYLDETLP